MKIVKIILKSVGFVLLTFVVLVGLYFLSAYTLSRIEVAGDPVTSNEVTVYILTNGVHTDIVVPVKDQVVDWTMDIKFENTTSKDTAMKYLAFGWGDKGFYLETPTWADLKFSTAFKAAFSLSTTAIHSTFYKEMKEGDDCKKIQMSRRQYSMLVHYIVNSFQLDSNSRCQCIKTNANYGPHDAFYDAKGSYNLFHTCNTWTNNALKSCGQKACLWTPFDTGIFYHYRKN